jgi:chloramphenicol-sensitive protein RarD
VWLFHEPFAGPRLVGFALIWLALVIYTAEGWRSMRRQAAASTEVVAPRPVPASRR